MKKEKIIEKIKTGEMHYKDVSIFKKNDLDIIRAYIEVATKEELTELAKKNKSNYDVMYDIVSKEPKLFTIASKKLRSSYALGMCAVQGYGPNYAHLNKELQNEALFVYEAVKQDNDCVTLISDELLNSYSIGFDLLSINVDLWANLGNKLKNSKSFVCDAVNAYPTVLAHLNKEYRDDIEIVYTAVGKDGTTLQYASRRLRDDEFAVASAIKNDGRALKYASARYRADREFVLAAIRTYPLALEYANATLQDDESVVLEAVKRDPKAIEFASKRLLHDEKYLKLIIENYPEAEEAIKEVKKVEARSYKLKSIKSDDVHVRNGVVFGVKLDENKNSVYNEMMKKSYTEFLDKLTHAELLVLDRLLKAEANIIVEKIKKEGKKDLSERDIRTIAAYRKVYLRVKQLKLNEEDYDRSKVNMNKCYILVDDAYKIANKLVRAR